MFAVYSMLIRYRHIIAYSAAIITVFALLWYVHSHGYEACEKDVIIKTIEVGKIRNEIANNKPSVIDVISGMRSGSF